MSCSKMKYLYVFRINKIWKDMKLIKITDKDIFNLTREQ